MQEHRFARLFSILCQLSPHSQVTERELAKEYGLDRKNIEKDIKLLRNSKLGIYKDTNGAIKIHRNGFRKIRSWIFS